MNAWLTFLANIRSDASYALRRLKQTTIMSAAAVLSLALPLEPGLPLSGYRSIAS